jgi:hypothetical protein
VPWSEKSIMSQRHEFVVLFEREGVEPPRVASAVWYQPDGWLSAVGAVARGGQGGSGGPLAAPAAFAGAQLGGDGRLGAGGARRASCPGWPQDPSPAAGCEAPGASAITAILRRHGRIEGQASAGHEPFERFEGAAPNELWQMDYKGHFALRSRRRHPLTVGRGTARGPGGRSPRPGMTRPE